VRDRRRIGLLERQHDAGRCLTGVHERKARLEEATVRAFGKERYEADGRVRARGELGSIGDAIAVGIAPGVWRRRIEAEHLLPHVGIWSPSPSGDASCVTGRL